MVMEFAGVQLSLATAIPIFTGDVSVSQEIIIKEGQVKVGDVLSSTLIFCMQVAEKPHKSVAVHVRWRIPVPIQPFIWLVLSA